MGPSYLSILRADETRDLARTGATVTVVTDTETDTDLGGVTTQESDGATYPVLLQSLAQPKEQRGAAGKQTAVETWVAYLPWNAAVGPADVLNIAGVRYQVEDTNGGDTDRLSLKVNLVKAS
jgi:hypothetical protein